MNQSMAPRIVYDGSQLNGTENCTLGILNPQTIYIVYIVHMCILQYWYLTATMLFPSIVHKTRALSISERAMAIDSSVSLL